MVSILGGLMPTSVTKKIKRMARPAASSKPAGGRSQSRRLAVRLIAPSDEVLWLLAGSHDRARTAIRQRHRP